MPNRTGSNYRQFITGDLENAGAISRVQAMAALPPVVYAAHVGDTIKIGHTADLPGRIRSLRNYRSAAVELLAFRVGTYEDEQALHAQLVEHRAYGREYYDPAPPVLEIVNAMRADLDLPATA